MPIIQDNSNARVLVTGANGYVATWVVRVLLEQGYTVRGTVRSESKGQELKTRFASYGDKFEWVVIEDITKEGAFDEVVKDVDAIEHTASPVSPDSNELQAYIQPAVEGTVGILKSALAYGKNVKRIVITSSLAAMLQLADGPMVLDEKDWGDDFVKLAEQLDKEGTYVIKYVASKVLAERAAWNLYEAHRSEISWDMVVVNPSHVIGAPLQDFKKQGEETLSLKRWFEFALTEQPDSLLTESYGYVHVEDVAKAHAQALKKEAAAGERIILNAGTSTWQDTRDFLFVHKPEFYTSGVLSRGKPELKPEITLTLNSRKAQDLLGLEYKGFEESTLGIWAEYESRGLIPGQV